MNWLESRIIAFDLETTDFDPVEDRILQMAVTVYDPVLDAFTPELALLCGVDVPISPGATAVHGICAEDVMGLPSADERLDKLSTFLMNAMEDDHVFAAFNAPFDLAFLMQAYKRVGEEFPIDPMKVIDPLAFARDVWPYNKQRELALRIGVPVGQMHDALKDVRLTVPVLMALAKQLELPSDLDVLLTKQEECIRTWEKKTSHRYRDALRKVDYVG
jgi:DNA polymerase III epsilon subunit-like protein